MTHRRRCSAAPALPRLAAAGIAGLLLAGAAAAQGSGSAAPSAAATSPATASGKPATSEPSPWYVGISQGLTHESNVDRVPSGSSDTYSTSSLFGGFDQRLGRQRLYGRAGVALNRYFDEDRLDNTSYDLNLGLDWETVGNLSGNVDATRRRFLAAPAAVAGLPDAGRNIGTTQAVDARVRWGGVSLLTLEATGHHSTIDYSGSLYAPAESTSDAVGLTLWYKPGGPFRFGIGAGVDRTRTPKALYLPLEDDYASNTEHGKHVDFYVDYDPSPQLSANLRLSYTRQRNSLVDAADFSGITGRLGATWQATGKLAFSGYVSRDAGFETATSSSIVVAPGSASSAQLLGNNRLTYSAELSAAYAVSGRIGLSAGVHYDRGRLVSSTSDGGGVNTTDELKSAFLGASYAIRPNWSASCRLAREVRTVSGFVDYSYDVNSVGCLTTLTWR